MSKKALLMLPISLIVLSTASCSWFFEKTQADVINEQNPESIINKAYEGGYGLTTYSNFEIEDANDVLLRKLQRIHDFTYVKTTPELSDVTFNYSMRMPSLFFTHREGITFYSNGYASTYASESDSKKYSGTYYYQFDQEEADALFKYVKERYDYIKEQERLEKEEKDRIESEYNQMIEDMTIFTIIEKMNEEENVDLQFFFVTNEDEPRYYDFTFKDDGSIYTALKNATYTEFDQSRYEEDALLANLNIRGKEWSIGIDRKSRGVIASFDTYDKYYRSYGKRIEKTIDVDSINIIMNRAYELSTPSNPFGSSSNPSTSSEE